VIGGHTIEPTSGRPSALTRLWATSIRKPATESGNLVLVLVARLSPQSRARTGGRAELWLDSSKLHFFDPDTGMTVNGN
jgi:hypothetical protein